MTKRRIRSEPIQRWHPAEEAMLIAQYPHMKSAVIARMLDRPLSGLYQKAQKLGLAKSDAFKASPASGRTTGRQGIGSRFPKGHVPANKGLRRPGWAPGRMRETQFKPGVRHGIAVKLYKPIGTERVSKDGYVERKTNDGMPLQKRWRGVHILNWEAVNGPLPKGHVIRFRDGIKTNTALDNLECLTRAEHARRNILAYPLEIRQITQLRGAITRQINKRTRREKQD